MAETLTEEQVKDMMKLNERAVEVLNLDKADIMVAEDLSEMTRDSNESPSDFHTRRRFAITKIVNLLDAEWQKRENKLLEISELMGEKIQPPKDSDVSATKSKVINDLVNGKYPITLHINQVWQMILDAEKQIAYCTTFALLPSHDSENK